MRRVNEGVVMLLERQAEKRQAVKNVLVKWQRSEEK